MDVSTVTSIVGIVLTILGISVAVIALDEARRAELLRFWKRWLKIVFVVVVVLNSAAGIYLFVIGPEQVVRSDILRLMLHLFNLLGLPGIWFLDALGRLMDAREAKRKELESAIEVLSARLDALAPATSESAR